MKKIYVFLSLQLIAFVIVVVTLRHERSHSNDLEVSVKDLQRSFEKSHSNNFELEQLWEKNSRLYEKMVSALVSQFHLADKIDEAKQTIINNQDEIITKQKKEIEHLRTMLPTH
ncbi:MAG: hypothetical protein V4697_01365 [Patescibacteria group bacterium]